MMDAARLTAEGMQAEFCKFWSMFRRNHLLVRAGVGWDPGIVGIATIGTISLPCRLCVAYRSARHLNHLENEERFRTPELLVGTVFIVP